MIHFIGDTHGYLEISKLEFTPAKEGDYVIVLGDFGLLWTKPNEKGYKQDLWWLKWLQNKPFTTLFVDGNHENFNLLNSYPVEEWNGGKVHRINDKVIHLMRGQVFTIDGKTIFTMGGASSTDQAYREEDISWWKEELPTQEEYDEALANLDKCDWKVDYVCTHCAPNRILKQIGYWMKKDRLTCFLDTLVDDLDFECWFFGHYHIDNSWYDEKKNLYLCIYNKIGF